MPPHGATFQVVESNMGSDGQFEGGTLSLRRAFSLTMKSPLDINDKPK